MGLPMGFGFDHPPPILHDLTGDALRRPRGSLIDDYVNELEVERGKIGRIDGLGGQLPLCMSLIGTTIDKLKVEAAQCKVPVMRRPPVLEEFLPVRGCKSGDQRCRSEAKDCRDKRDWMRSAQLWTDPSQVSEKKRNFDTKMESEELHTPKDAKLFIGGNKASDSESFSSLKKFACNPSKFEDKIAPVTADLTLMVPSCQNTSTKADELGFKSFFGLHQTLSPENQAYLGSQQHLRKARRCWSQELHRKFVKALDQLGGAKVATPKQIREHMRVNDLTNDEVKSHLQKYRIHLKRSSHPAARSLSQPLCSPREVWDSHNILQPSRPSSSHSASHQSPFQRECTFDSSGDGCTEDEEKSYESKLRH